jgi:uncharacterized protein
VAGRRVAAPPASLDVAWQETAPLVAELAAGVPLVVDGRKTLKSSSFDAAGVARLVTTTIAEVIHEVA